MAEIDIRDKVNIYASSNLSIDDYASLRSDGNLKGIDVNLANAPDLLLTVAVLGAVDRPQLEYSAKGVFCFLITYTFRTT